jgi:hypothetical protein
MTKAIKSAFAPMRPSVTLSVSPEAPPKTQPAVPPPKEAPPKPKRKAAAITVELWLEIFNKPGKICPAWAYLAHEPPLARLVAVLNAAHWPAAAALARKDVQAIRWLAATALLDRLALAGNDPVGRPLLRTICGLVIGPGWQWYQAGLWCAYLAKDHPLLGSETPELFRNLPPLRNEFYRAIPVDQLKSVWQIRECLRRCRQGLVNRAVTTFMRIVRLSVPIQFPSNEEK